MLQEARAVYSSPLPIWKQDYLIFNCPSLPWKWRITLLIARGSGRPIFLVCGGNTLLFEEGPGRYPGGFDFQNFSSVYLSLDNKYIFQSLHPYDIFRVILYPNGIPHLSCISR